MNRFIRVLDTAPASIAIVCLALALVIGTDAKFRRTVGSIAILLPLTPIMLVRLAGLALIAAADWMLRPRRWNAVMVERARWLADEYAAED